MAGGWVRGFRTLLSPIVISVQTSLRQVSRCAQISDFECSATAVLNNRIEMLFRESLPKFRRQTPPPLLIGCRPHLLQSRDNFTDQPTL
jgi:hypothetical protein